MWCCTLQGFASHWQWFAGDISRNNLHGTWHRSKALLYICDYRTVLGIDWALSPCLISNKHAAFCCATLTAVYLPQGTRGWTTLSGSRLALWRWACLASR